jgi:hypothetical protein
MLTSKLKNNKSVPKSGEAIKKLAEVFNMPYQGLQKIALESIELLRIQSAQNQDIGQYRLAIARGNG